MDSENSNTPGWVIKPKDEDWYIRQLRDIKPMDMQKLFYNYPPPDLTVIHILDVIAEYKSSTGLDPKYVFIGKGEYHSLQKDNPGFVSMFSPSQIKWLNDMPPRRVIATFDNLSRF